MSITKEHISSWLKAYAAAITARVDELNQLDGATGDGDFGASMQRGVQGILSRLPSAADKDIATIFKTTAMTLISTMGGTSGPLLGTLFLQMSTAVGGKTELGLADWAAVLAAGVDGVMARGKAQVGDKTMIDAFAPGVQALKAAAEKGESLADGLKNCAAAAKAGSDNTATLVAKKGRASYIGERGLGHIDAGSVNAYLLLQSLADVVA